MTSTDRMQPFADGYHRKMSYSEVLRSFSIAVLHALEDSQRHSSRGIMPLLCNDWGRTLPFNSNTMKTWRTTAMSISASNDPDEIHGLIRQLADLAFGAMDNSESLTQLRNVTIIVDPALIGTAHYVMAHCDWTTNVDRSDKVKDPSALRHSFDPSWMGRITDLQLACTSLKLDYTLCNKHVVIGSKGVPSAEPVVIGPTCDTDEEAIAAALKMLARCYPREPTLVSYRLGEGS
jgi:hypothetical protein